MLTVINNDFSDFIDSAESQFLENKLMSFMIKKKMRNESSENIHQFIFNSDISGFQELIKLKKDNFDLLMKIENVLNQSQMLESYCNILSIFIQSHLTFAWLVCEKTYSWKNFLFIIKSLLAKSIRDAQEQKLNFFINL